MTTDEINIAIAKACGWKFDGRDVWTSPEGLEYQALYGSEDKYGTPLPPNYTTDLNAMREAECFLYAKGIYAETYAVKLMSVVKPRILEGSHQRSTAQRHFELISSTASQRAEAFLRTLNLWKD